MKKASSGIIDSKQSLFALKNTFSFCGEIASNHESLVEA